MTPDTKRALRLFFRKLHLWFGLALVMPVVMLAITGSLLTWQRELDALLHPRLFTPLDEAPDHPPLSADAVLLAVHNYDPRPLVSLALPDPVWPVWVATVRQPPVPSEHHRDHEGRMMAPGGPQVEIFVDPQTGQILGERNRDATVLRFLRRLHSSLTLGEAGRPIMGWCGVVLLVLQLSGLYLWWPKSGRWKAAVTLRRGASGRALLRDLHNVAAIWLWLVLLTVTVTGMTLCFHQTTRALLGLPPSTMRMGVAILPPDQPYPVTAEQALAAVRTFHPQSEVINLRPAGKETAFWTIILRPRHGLRSGPETIRVDARTGTIAPQSAQSPAQIYINEQHALHGGVTFGKAGRVLVFTASLALLLLGITGLWSWTWQRRRTALTAKGPA